MTVRGEIERAINLLENRTDDADVEKALIALRRAEKAADKALADVGLIKRRTA